MIENFPVSLEYVLAEEGGYSNHPKDPGGATMKGVIQREYNLYRRNKGLDQRSVKQITNGELTDIYNASYWDLVKADQLPSGLDYCVFDFAVNSGPSQAVKILQRAINTHGNRNIEVDGLVGPTTLDAANSVDTKELITEVCTDRGSFLRGLKSLFPTFGKGWMVRVKRVQERSLAMTVPMPVKPPVVIPAPLGTLDAPKGASKAPDLISGLSATAGAALLTVVNNPYALTFALVLVVAGGLYLYSKYK